MRQLPARFENRARTLGTTEADPPNSRKSGVFFSFQGNGPEPLCQTQALFPRTIVRADHRPELANAHDRVRKISLQQRTPAMQILSPQAVLIDLAGVLHVGDQ